MVDSPENADTVLLQRSKLVLFNNVYDQYWSKLYLSAYSILRDKAAAEDIVQEVMVELWYKRDITAIQSIAAYLHTAVRYQVYKAVKRGSVTVQLPENFDLIAERIDSEDLLDAKELSNLLDYHIDQLPDKCREVFILSRKHYLSIKDIALQLQISTKTVENHLTNALKKLRLGIGDFAFWLLIALPALWR